MTESKPDFSGDYILNREACTLSPGASAVRTAALHIEHHEPVIRCSARFVFVDSHTFEFTTERTSERRELVDQEPTPASSLHWDGSGLVFTDRMGEPPAEVLMTWRYELIEEGRRLRAVEQMRGGGRDQDNVWAFDRQHAAAPSAT